VACVQGGPAISMADRSKQDSSLKCPPAKDHFAQSFRAFHLFHHRKNRPWCSPNFGELVQDCWDT